MSLSTMLCLLNILLLVIYAVDALAVPHDSIPLNRRNESSAIPKITTTVRSANGTDVTPSFRTMVYWQPNKVAADKNLTERQSSARRMNRCRSHTARFIQSHCAHSRGFEVSLLEYTVHCQEYPSPRYNFAMGYDPTGELLQPLVTTEEGACLPHEICVNDMPHTTSEPMTATCVDMDNFFPVNNQGRAIKKPVREPEGGSNEGTAIQEAQESSGGSGVEWTDGALQAIDKALGGKRASIVISGQNGTMPLGVGTLEVDAGAEGGRVVQQQTCTKCFGLRTRKTAMDTDFLKTKATLMATTAMTGIVWMTVFAG